MTVPMTSMVLNLMYISMRQNPSPLYTPKSYRLQSRKAREVSIEVYEGMMIIKLIVMVEGERKERKRGVDGHV